MSDLNTPASPKKVGIALIVGNGFTLDFTQHIGLWGLDIAKPLDWELTISQEAETLRSQDALPHFFRAVRELSGKYPAATQFEILRLIAGDTSEENKEAEIEARHYLRLAFSFLDWVLWQSDIEDWRWAKWLREHSHLLVSSVSFNYELLFERTITYAGRRYARYFNKVNDEVVRIFKPHGSIDFDIVPQSDGQVLKFPLRIFSKMNNFPLHIRSLDSLSTPPIEPLIVPPYASNQYMSYQWVSPGYQIFSKLGPYITHCLFIGLSYHPADRAEIDHFLHSTPADCCIIVANPDPHPDFIKAIEATNRRLVVWRSGPEPLP